MVKIVVLDALPFQIKDFDFLAAFGECSVYEYTSSDQIMQYIVDADFIFTNKVAITADIFKVATKLKFIGVLATGFNVIDIIEARKYGVIVSNIPSYSTDSVAQHTFALLFEMCNHVVAYNNIVKNGTWAKSNCWSIVTPNIIELSGKTFGIIGMGMVGGKVAKIAHAFGMKVIAYSRTIRDIQNIAFVTLNYSFRVMLLVSTAH